jgi:hypothetical protein
MQVGQKVVCVDDHFPTPLAKYYLNLPVKDKVYTIRAVYLGRGVMHSAPGESDGQIGLLLHEIVNGPDPRNKYQQELGFNSERFVPLRTMDTSEEDEEELVGVRAAPKSEPLKALPLPSSK